MKRAVLLRSLVALSLSAPAATAAEHAGQASNDSVTAPTGKWVVDFDDSQCVASRNYGSDGEPLGLALKAPPVGEVMQVVVVRRGKGGRYADQLNAKISIDGGKSISTSMIAMMTGQDNQRSYRVNLPLEQFSAVRHAKTLSIQGGREFSETFAISQMASLLKVMDECVADLRKVWNVTEAGAPAPALRERARGTLEGLITAKDYPGIAIDELAEGSVAFAVLIDETGKVADCTVTQTSGVAALDAQSCAIVKQRARFKPAVGLNGQPAKDTYHQRITWKVEF
ncbi:MAG: energy transducer TonB [Pseudomonadota bacterium]|nr:energy transducer TonB [Pseudomonadota bacterium]